MVEMPEYSAVRLAFLSHSCWSRAHGKSSCDLSSMRSNSAMTLRHGRRMHLALQTEQIALAGPRVGNRTEAIRGQKQSARLATSALGHGFDNTRFNPCA